MKTLRHKLTERLERVEHLFLLLALPFGLAIALLTPPYQCMDEANHFSRAYQISMGDIIPERRGDALGGMIPASIGRTIAPFKRFYYNPPAKHDPDEFQRMLDMPLDREKTVFTEFYNTALYAPVVYLPHLPGIVLGKWLNLGPVKMLYLGRISGLIGYITLIFCAIRLTPIGKWLFFILALMPVPLFLGSCVNADCVVIGASYLFIALTFRYAFSQSQDELPRRHIYLLALVGGVLSVSKMAYMPLVVLYLLIPRERLGGNRAWWRATLVFYFIVFGLFFIWTAISIGLHVHPNPNVSAVRQFHFIVSHPIDFFKIICSTLYTHQLHILFTMVGALGYLETLIPNVHFISYIWVILFAAMVEGKAEVALDGRRRTLLAVIFVFTCFFLTVLVYMNSMEVGSTDITDLGGRYFIPMLPVMLLALYNRNYMARNPIWHRLFFAGYVTISLTITSLVIYFRYYVA